MATTLYGFWRSLASLRVRIVLNLKGVAFAEPAIDLLKGEQFADGYRRINPQSMLPALDLGDGEPALFQSIAICEYLDEVHPNPPLLPRDPRGRARVRGLAMIPAADAHPLVVPRIRNYLERELGLDEPARLKWIHRWIDEASGAIESHLAGERATGKYCHGDAITLADVCVFAHFVGAQLFQADLKSFPTIARIVDTCMQTPAFAKSHPRNQPGAPAAGH
jgi:maleylacetoacetate isomerase